MTTKFVGVKQFRQNMAKISEEARKNNERLIILRKNKPIFELKPLSEGSVFKESFIRKIERSLEDEKAGRIYDFEEVCEELGL